MPPKRTLADAKSRGLKSPPAVPMAPAVTPAVTAPVTAPATVHASPAVTPAVSPPLHVRQIIEAGGGSRRKREDRCRLGSSGPARKNQTCNSDRKYCAQHMCPPYFPWLMLFIEAVGTTDKLKNMASRSMNGRSARNKRARPVMSAFGPKRLVLI